MRKSRFTDEQIVAILRECDRTSVAEAAKKHKVSEQTIYVWRRHFAGLAPAGKPINVQHEPQRATFRLHKVATKLYPPTLALPENSWYANIRLAISTIASRISASPGGSILVGSLRVSLSQIAQSRSLSFSNTW